MLKRRNELLIPHLPLVRSIMQFPSPDPLWIIEIFKVTVLFALSTLLFWKWGRAERRFYTDFPFLIALAILFIAFGECMEIIVHSGLAVFTLELFKLRASITGISMLMILFIIIRIWLAENMRIGWVLMAIFAITFFTAIALAPTMELAQLFAIAFLPIIMIVFVITFLWAWRLRRLPDVHSLVLVLGVIILMTAQVIKAVLQVIGLAYLVWITELVDLLGYTILATSFLIKPGWAKRSQIASTSPTPS